MPGHLDGAFPGDPRPSEESNHQARPSPARAEAPRTRSLPVRLTVQEIAAIDRLAAERSVEESARDAVRSSMARQATILSELASGGVPFTTVAHRLAALAGTPAPVDRRRRLAKRLCKRRMRAVATSGRHVLAATPAPAKSPSLRSVETTDAAQGGEEQQTMAQLVKRTITEEYSVDEDIDGIDEMDDEDEDLEEESDEVAPSRRSKK
ncbi:MAG: hypothetical protein IPO09_02305 [Anaeromyxobacter sp.]|nr:hypothetical protein [Anaeromyxobacter sp.]